MHQYYASDKFVTNCKAFDIWIDIPRTTPQKDGWTDAKRISPKKYNSSTPKKPRKKPNSTTELSPRTSTPVMDEKSCEVKYDNISKNPYESWKHHLHETPKNLKIRGTPVNNKTIISGHLVMKNLEPFSYTYEQHFMPNLNKCLMNLLINGVSPLYCEEHRDPRLPNQMLANCNCIPVCNCREKLALNMNLPATYKYNENGFVVPAAPSIDQLVYYRDPNCIYTT